jgi:hypothetical protein
VFNSAPLSAYDVATGAVVWTRPIVFDATGVPGHNSDFFEINPAGTLLAVTQVPDKLLVVDAKTGKTRRELRAGRRPPIGIRVCVGRLDRSRRLPWSPSKARIARGS